MVGVEACGVTCSVTVRSWAFAALCGGRDCLRSDCEIIEFK